MVTVGRIIILVGIGRTRVQRRRQPPSPPTNDHTIGTTTCIARLAIVHWGESEGQGRQTTARIPVILVERQQQDVRPGGHAAHSQPRSTVPACFTREGWGDCFSEHGHNRWVGWLLTRAMFAADQLLTDYARHTYRLTIMTVRN